MALPSAEIIRQQVGLALAEDIGSGDLTAALIDPGSQAEVEVICREAVVICGCTWFDETFAQLDSGLKIQWLCQDGDALSKDSLVCRLSGPACHILSGERVALNFLQTLSAVATATRAFVDLVAGTGANILDTRKTIPGLRLAQKYAVTCGGGVNHRIGLYDAILIKENHITAAGSISAALNAAQELNAGVEIEIEVESLDELDQALSAGAKRLLLDNFSVEQLKQAVAQNKGRARLEASGNVNQETVRKIAETGVDDISIGSLTKDIRAIDLSMRFV